VYDPTLEEKYYFQDTTIDEQNLTIEWHAASLWQPESRSTGDIVCPSHLQRFKELLKTCDACVLIYSCTTRWHFKDIARLWASIDDDDDLVRSRAYTNVWVAHNKIDVDEEDWLVSQDEGKRWSSSIGATFVPMSTRTGQGCTPDFGEQMARRVWDPQRLTYTIPDIAAALRDRSLLQVRISVIRPIMSGGRSLIERVCRAAQSMIYRI